MAVSEGKLRVKGTDGIEREITLYTSPDDIVGDYKELKYNGEIVYASTTTDVTAIATGDADGATELCYKDTDGTIHYFATKTPLAATTGTVSISGALSVDMAVNGNLTVSGAISSNVRATGTISYGSLTGTAVANATLYSCDLQVSGGTLTFAAAVSESDGGMYTTGRVTNASGVTSTVYGRLVINGTTSNILYNNGGTFVVADGGYASATTTSSSESTGVIYNTSSGTFTVNEGGELMCSSSGRYGFYINSGTVVFDGSATCSTSAAYDGIYNYGGTLTVGVTGKLTCSCTSSRYGFDNYSGTATINGTVIATANTSYGAYNSATLNITETGSITATGAYGFRNTSTATISGTLTAVATNASYYALYNTSTMTVTDTGRVHAYNTAGGGVIYNSTTNLTVQDGGQLLLTAAPTDESEDT